MNMRVAAETGYIPFAAGPYPVREGNRLRPLVDGEPAFRRICEAIEAAERSVWATVAFLDEHFEMPDGRGSLFDVLDRAAARGLDVRVIFWRINTEHWRIDSEESIRATGTYYGDAAQRAALAARGSGFHARWDRAERIYCQHQKSWLIDAGHPGEIAFVGGINLHRASMVAPGHAHDGHSTHDVYLEIAGPCASDVHANFVQRWNGASERDAEDGFWPTEAHAGDLSPPSAISPHAGDIAAQVQRTVRAGHYGLTAPEHTVFEQYRLAFQAARSSIYIENQSLGSPETVEDLHAALARGVDVVVLAPADPNDFMVQARRNPRTAPFFERLGALGEHPNFLLAGIAAPDGSGALRNVYVHAKIALIDDAWATIGSCNIGARSFFGDTELNVSFWDPRTVHRLRRELLHEHLCVDTGALDDRAAFAQYRTIAQANADRRRNGEALSGLAFALDPKSYAA